MATQSPYFPGAQEMVPMNNPSVNYLENMVLKQEEENKWLEGKLLEINNEDGNFDAIARRAGDDIEQLKQKLLPNGGGVGGPSGEPFPEDYGFVQNNIWSEDLEVEERALVSLHY